LDFGLLYEGVFSRTPEMQVTAVAYGDFRFVTLEPTKALWGTGEQVSFELRVKNVGTVKGSGSILAVDAETRKTLAEATIPELEPWAPLTPYTWYVPKFTDARLIMPEHDWNIIFQLTPCSVEAEKFRTVTVTHIPPAPLFCPVCGEEFPDEYSLLAHMREKHPFQYWFWYWKHDNIPAGKILTASIIIVPTIALIAKAARKKR